MAEITKFLLESSPVLRAQFEDMEGNEDIHQLLRHYDFSMADVKLLVNFTCLYNFDMTDDELIRAVAIAHKLESTFTKTLIILARHRRCNIYDINWGVVEACDEIEFDESLISMVIKHDLIHLFKWMVETKRYEFEFNDLATSTKLDEDLLATAKHGSTNIAKYMVAYIEKQSEIFQKKVNVIKNFRTKGDKTIDFESTFKTRDQYLKVFEKLGFHVDDANCELSNRFFVYKTAFIHAGQGSHLELMKFFFNADKREPDLYDHDREIEYYALGSEHLDLGTINLTSRAVSNANFEAFEWLQKNDIDQREFYNSDYTLSKVLCEENLDFYKKIIKRILAQLT